MSQVDPLSFLSLSETANKLNLDERTVRRLIHDGQIKAANVGTAAKPHWRISIVSLLDIAGEADKLAFPEISKPQLGLNLPDELNII